MTDSALGEPSGASPDASAMAVTKLQFEHRVAIQIKLQNKTRIVLKPRLRFEHICDIELVRLALALVTKQCPGMLLTGVSVTTFETN